MRLKVSARLLCNDRSRPTEPRTAQIRTPCRSSTDCHGAVQDMAHVALRRGLGSSGGVDQQENECEAGDIELDVDSVG